MSYRLAAIAVVVLVGVSFIDAVEVGVQADFAGTYLRYDRADGPVYAYIYGQETFSEADSKLV
jgi:hypothetical protein